MKIKYLALLISFACFHAVSTADIITPTDADSSLGSLSNRPIEDAIDGSGLSSDGSSGDILSETHANAGANDGPYFLGAIGSVLTFDLGGTYDVNAVHIWTYTRTGEEDRAIKNFDISFSSDGVNFSSTLAVGDFSQVTYVDSSTVVPVQTLSFASQAGITHVRLDNVTNYGDAGYTGFGEIRFGGTSGGTPAGPVDAGTSTVTASPSSVTADGSTTSTITVTLRDASNIPVTGEEVTLTNTSGLGTPTISPSSTQTTDGSGVATFTVSSSTLGTEVFTATSSTDTVPITQTASVEFTAPVVVGPVNAGKSTVVASPLSVTADGSATSTITVTLRDASDNLVTDEDVTLANTSGPGSPTISPSGTQTTNGSGVATFTVRSSTTGTEVFTATSSTDNVTITQTASVEFTAVPVAGPVDAGMSTVVASPTSVDADGSEVSTITVTLLDANGLAVESEGVSLENTSGPGSPTITPLDIQATDANGQATFTVSSSTPGIEVFTATAVGDGVIITQTASVEFTEVVTSLLITLINNPVTGITSAEYLTTGSIIEDLWDNEISLSDVGTRNGEGGGFAADSTDSDGYAGDSIKSHTVLFDMGDIVTFDGFVHAQRHESLASSVGTMQFWVSNTDPGSDFTTIANTYFGTTPEASVDLNTGDRNLHDYVFNGVKLTGRYVIMRWITSDQSSGGGSPGGYTFRLGQTASVGDFDTWRGGYPGLGAETEDDDGDTLSNDYERLFGLNPLDASSANPISTALDSLAGTFSYTRRTQVLTSMTYKIWYSTDLTEWFWESGASESVGSPVNDIETVDVTLSSELLNEPKLFLRMTAEDFGAPPVMSQIWGSGNTVIMVFTEAMDPDTATDTDNYTVQQDGGGTLTVTAASLSGDGKTVNLTLGSQMGIASSFTVTANGVANGVGQPLGNGTTGQFQTWDNDPNGIKVFILAGQSNMVGYGKTELGGNPDWTSTNGEPKEIPGGYGCLRYLAQNNASFPVYDFTKLLETPSDPANSAWTTRSDVKLWWKNGGSGNLDGPLKKGDLGPLTNNNQWFGPELGFGEIIGDYYASDDVLIIKAAWGGHNLVSQFRPPSAVAARGGEVGASYYEIFDDARQVLNNLGTEFPEWAGRGYQIVGFGWHQGTSDKAPASAADEYKFNLRDFIADVRGEFANPDLPFVIATAGMQDSGPVDSTYDSYHPVERAQLWDYAEVPKPANVLSSDTRGFWRDASISPSTTGFHWNHNAESYFLVGKALGDDMVTLLDQ